MDATAASLAPLLALAAEDEAAGLGDAPWPPHYDKQAGEPPRGQPSKRRTGGTAGAVAPPAPGKSSGPTGRRRSTMPLIEVARAAFFFSSRRRHTSSLRDWSSDVCSSD